MVRMASCCFSTPCGSHTSTIHTTSFRTSFRSCKHQDPGCSPMPKEREKTSRSWILPNAQRERGTERERSANAKEESSETEGCGCGSANQGHVEFGDARLALRVHHQRCQNHGSPPLTLSRSACMRARVGCMCCVRERERERERENPIHFPCAKQNPQEYLFFAPPTTSSFRVTDPSLTVLEDCCRSWVG
jgi:hypothetical protein